MLSCGQSSEALGNGFLCARAFATAFALRGLFAHAVVLLVVLNVVVDGVAIKIETLWLQTRLLSVDGCTSLLKVVESSGVDASLVVH